MTGLGDIDPSTIRILFRKIAKGLDNKNFILAQYKLQIEQLKARIEQLALRKRRKVQTSPNSKFMEIKAIIKAQIKARDRKNKSDKSAELIKLSSILFYIIIKLFT